MLRPDPNRNGLRLSIVVPCYNEQENLRSLHSRVSAAASAAVGASFEVVLVNDGSRDQTWQGLRQLAQDDPRVVAVNLSRNHGHQLALSAGLSLCSGERVLVLDADLQDPPELLGDMMKLMDEGADVVYGQRTEREGESFFKRWSARQFYRLLSGLSDVPIPLDAGDFRLMSARVVSVLNSMPEQHRFIRGMVSWVGFRQVPLPYVRESRHAGTSGYPFRRMLRLAMDAITGFSTRPLRIASLLGLLFAAMGALGVVATVISWLIGRTVPGWTSFMVVMLVLGGVQLAVIGILGEYIGRLYIEVKRRPLYLIDEVCGTVQPARREMPAMMASCREVGAVGSDERS